MNSNSHSMLRLFEGSIFVHDLFFRYLRVHKRKTDRSKLYKPADDVTWNVTYIRKPCRCMMTIIIMILAAKEALKQH